MNKASEQINPTDRNRYSVIPRVLIFLFKDNSVLLIKGAATKKLWPGKYNGLGGHLEKGEDPLGAARRELVEESGLVCESLDLCGTVVVDTGSSPGVAIFIYIGEYEGGELRSSLEGMPEWITGRTNRSNPRCGRSAYDYSHDQIPKNWRPGYLSEIFLRLT